MSAKLTTRYPGAALVTGASGGLGECFARYIASQGMDVVLVARREDEMTRIAKELTEAHGIKATVLAEDLIAPDAADRIRAATDAKGIDVSLLVNNAGYGSYGSFDELDAATEIRMVDLNCRAPVALTAAYLPAMVERKNGAIIFLGSVASYQPTPFFSTYGATKAFNLMFGEALWAEYKPKGIDVICLSPGYTRTEFQKNANVTNLPASGWAQPEDVVAACFKSLGRGPSLVPGFANLMTSWMARVTTRATAAKLAHRVSNPNK